jgi:predicted N-formylglutamate amidohydrolase
MSAVEGWPRPVEIVNEGGASPFVLVCEHASNYIPPAYRGLGLSAADLQRHIAWDIGAAHLARTLAAQLDAPAFLGTYSRLLIDLNRPTDAPSSICLQSEATEIPGNRALTEAERVRRIEHIFMPFQRALERHITKRREARRPCVLVCLHSFTPVYLGKSRAVHIGVLFDQGETLAQAIIAGLRARNPGLEIGPNVPYGVSREEDYALLVHGDDLGNPAVLIEMRHDLIAQPADGERWAAQLSQVLTASLPSVL